MKFTSTAAFFLCFLPLSLAVGGTSTPSQDHSDLESCKVFYGHNTISHLFVRSFNRSLLIVCSFFPFLQPSSSMAISIAHCLPEELCIQESNSIPRVALVATVVSATESVSFKSSAAPPSAVAAWVLNSVKDQQCLPLLHHLKHQPYQLLRSLAVCQLLLHGQLLQSVLLRLVVLPRFGVRQLLQHGQLRQSVVLQVLLRDRQRPSLRAVLAAMVVSAMVFVPVPSSAAPHLAGAAWVLNSVQDQQKFWRRDIHISSLTRFL